MADKDYEGLLAAFEPVLAHIVCTQNSTERSMPAEELAEVARGIFGQDRVSVAPSLADAIDQAAALAEAGGVFGEAIGSGRVLVTGSVVTVGEARALLPLRGRRARLMPRRLCAAILLLEAIALGLSTPVLISVADMGTATALWIGLGLMRRLPGRGRAAAVPWAYWLGWAIQVAAVAVGVVVATMFFVGAIFLLLWATAYLLGPQDRGRARRVGGRGSTPAGPARRPDLRRGQRASGRASRPGVACAPGPGPSCSGPCTCSVANPWTADQQTTSAPGVELGGDRARGRPARRAPGPSRS